MDDPHKVLLNPFSAKYRRWRRWWNIARVTIFGLVMLGIGIHMRIGALNDDPRKYPRPEFVQKMNERTVDFSPFLFFLGGIALIVAAIWTLMMLRRDREGEDDPALVPPW